MFLSFFILLEIYFFFLSSVYYFFLTSFPSAFLPSLHHPFLFIPSSLLPTFFICFFSASLLPCIPFSIPFSFLPSLPFHSFLPLLPSLPFFSLFCLFPLYSPYIAPPFPSSFPSFSPSFPTSSFRVRHDSLLRASFRLCYLPGVNESLPSSPYLLFLLLSSEGGAPAAPSQSKRINTKNREKFT